MKLFSLAACLLIVGCQTALQPTTMTYDDLASVEAVEDGRVYRLGESGICGTVDVGGIQVTSIIPGSPADGSVRVGDRVTGLQYRGLGGNVRATVAKRIYRLGRDWNWRLYVTVHRPDALDGEGNSLTFPLTLPPTPGGVHHFGPTGIYAQTYPSELVVDKIAPGSPADGLLKPGDRITAVAGQPWEVDLFERWTRCIDDAEASDDGKLELTVSRTVDAGTDTERTEIVPITLQLQAFGQYSDTAPIDCKKTDAIIAKAADAIVAKAKHDTLTLELLGLLATGERQYIAYVGEALRRADFAKPDVETSLQASMTSWRYAYNLITMCEYFLLTGDEYVLPAIRKHAVAIAMGQDVAGLWNHRMANPAANFGQLHGRLYGYGAINQTSVALWIGLILSEKCGVDHPEVRAAVDKTHRLYSNWIDRGALPYGNHGYMEEFLTNNGTSGSAAVAFALLGDRRGARHFAALSAAAHDEILTGHTGPFFNIMWTGLGANVLGPDVAAAFDRKVHWLRTMTRQFNGQFHYIEARGGNFEYKAASSTGSQLLNLCVGRRAINLTGKAADRSLWLTGDEAVAAVDAGTIRDTSRKGLIAALGHSLPRVRVRAAQLLAVADRNVTADVMGLLARGDRNQRIGAIHAIEHLKIDAAADDLMAIAEDKDEDLWLRVLAINTLPTLEDTDRFASRLLKLLMRDKPDDARQDIDAALGGTLVAALQPDPLAHDLDKSLFYAAVNKLLAHPRMRGRGAGMRLIENIPLEDFAQVADSMIYVIKDRDRTYTSYHADGHRQAGLEILNRLDIKEVIPLTISTIKEPTGRGGPRVRGRLRLLETFDANAKPYIGQIREALGDKADAIIEKIEGAQTNRDMIPLAQAVEVGKHK
jgi:GNAT superfamily N-acetyltransferase